MKLVQSGSRSSEPGQNAVPREVLERRLSELGLERLSKICLILGSVYVVVAASHFFLLPPQGRLVMFVVAASGAAAMLGAHGWIKRHPEQIDRMGLLTAIPYAWIIAHSLGRLHYARGSADMVFVGVIAVGIALLPGRLWHHVAWLTTYLVGWSAIMIGEDGLSAWRPFAPPLVLTATVSIVIRALELRRERRLLELQLLEGVQRRELHRRAHHDRLTGLGNRARFAERAGQAFEQAEDEGSFAILQLDIDRFKVVNESLGHDVGDQLLRAVARRLLRFVRPGDTVARLGSDEFAVLLASMRAADDAIVVAERLRTVLAEPYFLDGYEVTLEASVGIAMYRPDYEDVGEMLRDADIAMGAAKVSEDKRSLFDGEMHARAVERLEIEVGLRRAVKEDELTLHYQPIVEAATGRLRGFEALVRWDHPDRGLLGPGTFLPAAEESGLMVEIGDWVLERACRDLGRLEASHGGDRPLHVSVNLSARQFLHEDFEEQLADVLHRTGVAPEQLWLEVVETTVLDRPKQAELRIRRLLQLGVKVCVDDFGVGYSSLGYLQRLSFSVLKLDRTFVTKGPKNEAIVASVVSLAHALDMDVVAEGVETEEQLERCRGFGCGLLQGYHLDAPMPLAEAEALVARPDPYGLAGTAAHARPRPNASVTT